MYTFDLRYPQSKIRTDLNQLNGQNNRFHLAMRSNDQGTSPSKSDLRSVSCCFILLKPNIVHIVENIQFWSDKVSSISQYWSEFTVIVNVVFFEEIQTHIYRILPQHTIRSLEHNAKVFIQLWRVDLDPVSKVFLIDCTTQLKVSLVTEQHNCCMGDI